MDSINKSRVLIPSSGQLGMILSKHGYIAKTEIVNVLFLALQLQKPLLLEGPPGAGKTQVAKVLSEALELPLIRLQCYEGIDEARALYQWNEPLQRIALEFIRQNGPSWLASVSVRWNLFNGFGDKARIDEAKHLLRQSNS